jgi:hypothetical protein
VTTKEQPASAGLTQVGGTAGLTEQAPASDNTQMPARTYARGAVRVWVRMMNRWVCALATDDYEKALRFARDQVRHDGSGTVDRVEIRALSDEGVVVVWESE